MPGSSTPLRPGPFQNQVRELLELFDAAPDGRDAVAAWNATARNGWTRPDRDPLRAELEHLRRR